MAIIDDIIEGCRGSKDYIGWSEVTRVIKVPVSLSTTTFQAKVDAAITTASLTMGAAHPEIAYVYLVKIDPVIESNDLVRLDCTYARDVSRGRRPENNTIEISGGIFQTNTDVDCSGASLGYLSYTYPSDYKFNGGQMAGQAGDKQKISVPIGKPTVIWCKYKIESSSPESKALEYQGSVNSSTWRSGAARTWRCNEISGVSRDGGLTFENRYVFEYNPETWDEVAYYVRDDGKIPDNVAEGTSKKTCAIIRQKNFNNIGL